MKSVTISLRMAEDVKEFVPIVEKYAFDIDLRSGRFVVNAKSILGIFSLDLSKPIVLEAHSENCDALIADLKKFII
ncbi:MAG: HPr family phosphocarrier protein [Clostridia bacterium]|nr:HPr family phosphocarrier protein [Clostridia bacterium]